MVSRKLCLRILHLSYLGLTNICKCLVLHGIAICSYNLEISYRWKGNQVFQPRYMVLLRQEFSWCWLILNQQKLLSGGCWYCMVMWWLIESRGCSHFVTISCQYIRLNSWEFGACLTCWRLWVQDPVPCLLTCRNVISMKELTWSW